jgi:hypothetical protein
LAGIVQARQRYATAIVLLITTATYLHLGLASLIIFIEEINSCSRYARYHYPDQSNQYLFFAMF